MDADADGCQMEVVEQHGQMIVQSSTGVEVQLQGARRGQRESTDTADAVGLLAEP